MKPLLIAILVVFCSNAQLYAEAPQTGEVGTFELTPSAPTAQFWLQTNPLDRLPGNAALLYGDAAATLNDDIKAKIDKAVDAYGKGDPNFDSLAAEVESAKVYSKVQGTFDLLDVGARRDYYDWDDSFRQQGAETLLPHLGAEREAGRLIAVRALRQIRAGQLDDAVNTLRLEYELGRKVGTEPILICGLVGVAIVGQAADVTGELIKQPNSPNLYWSLAGLPRPTVCLQRSLINEVADIPYTFPELAGDKIENATAAQWHSVFDRIVEYGKEWGDKSNTGGQAWENPKTIADEIDRDLLQARDFYGKYFNLPADQVESLDSFKVVLTYWYLAEQSQQSEFYDIMGLPYPLLAAKEKDFQEQIHRLQLAEPCNIFLNWTAGINRGAERYMRLDRELAALADVEAIRSYATANGGTLPAHLEDISDTPALDNPRTGRPFSYHVHGDTAELSDSLPAEHPLNYTIRIRQ
jgi:hypothetical protein